MVKYEVEYYPNIEDREICRMFEGYPCFHNGNPVLTDHAKIIGILYKGFTGFTLAKESESLRDLHASLLTDPPAGFSPLPPELED
jgi:hypothetical protein